MPSTDEKKNLERAVIMNIFLRLLLVVKRIAKAVLPHSVYEKLRVMYLKRSVVSSEL